MKKLSGNELVSAWNKQMKLFSFTLIELLVVIAIIAILAAILMPALSSARERAKHAQCASNQKSIAAAFQQYADDNKGMLPIGYAMNTPNKLQWIPSNKSDTTKGYKAGARWLCHLRYLPGNPDDSQRWTSYKILNCPAYISKGQTTSYFWFTGFPDSTWLSSIAKLPADPAKNERYLFGDVAGYDITWIDDKVHDFILNHPAGSNWARHDGSVVNLQFEALYYINRKNQLFYVPYEIRYGKDAKGIQDGLKTLAK